MQRIHFYVHDRKATFKNKKKLKFFLEDLFKKEKKLLTSLAYIFCSDDHLLEINKTFLDHDFYTDVISFELSETKNECEGEVYISIDRVKDNAKQLGITFNEELHRVIFHGALHLCGYHDKKKKEIFVMRSKENKYLKKYLH
jgi:rRNA maturation RNase YbeY